MGWGKVLVEGSLGEVMSLKCRLAGVLRLEGRAESSGEDEDDVEDTLSHEPLLLDCNRVTRGLVLILCGLLLVLEPALRVERVGRPW
jgi:hypothetical protein